MVLDNNLAVAGAAALSQSNRESGDPPSRIDLSEEVDFWADNAGDPSEPRFLKLSVDRVRVVGFLGASITPERLIGLVPGLSMPPQRRKGRNVGPRESVDHVGLAGHDRRGRQIFRVREVDGYPTEVRAEFNPAAVDAGVQAMIGEWFVSRAGVRRAWLRRVDAAFDFEAKRWATLLDDASGRRRVDRFGCGVDGCETERVGFSKGAEFKGRLYDKAKERAFNGDAGPEWAGVVRFEQQWEPRADDAPDVCALADVSWQGELGLRWFPFNPSRVREDIHRLLTLVGVHGGLVAMRPQVRVCLNAKRRESFWGCMCPAVNVEALYREHWAASVRRDLCGLLSMFERRAA